MIFNILVMVGVGFLLTQIANLATTVYLHRSLSHRALTLHQPLPALFRTTLWLTTGIRARQWVAVHRKHHAFTDEPDDPHSPARLGWLRVQLTNVALYRASARDERTVSRYAKDMPATRFDRMVFDRALVGLSFGVVMLTVLLSVIGNFPVWVPLGAAAFHFVGYIGLSGAINAVAHTFGRRAHSNSATNVQWLAFLTCGEGLHNNHHAAPTSARFSLQRREIDPGWLFIRACQTVGLVNIRHAEVKLARSATAT